MLIEIKGVQFVNKGAELMLYAILDKVKTTWPGAEICMEPDQNSPYIKRAQIGAYQKIRLIKNRFDVNGLSYFLPKRLRQFLKQTLGVVTEADVDIVFDASGFAYGDQWKYLPLKQASSIAKRFSNKGKYYMLMPQAFGPFSAENYQKAAKVLVEHATVAFARDEQSMAHITSLTDNANTQLAPDFTNLLVPELPVKYASLKDGVAVIPNAKMVSVSNRNISWREKYIEILVCAIKTIQSSDQDVFLLNHEGLGDQIICERINSQLKCPVKIISPDDCLTIKAIIGHCTWVICSRYHGCVSALSQKIPCLGTSWSHKYEKLFEDYGQKDWLLDVTVNSQSLESTIKKFIDSAKENSDRLTDPSLDLKEKSEQVWNVISESLH